MSEDHFSRALSGFLEEARKLAQFRHPNIVKVNRYFEAHGTGYFVMDHEAGGSLREIIEDADGPMSEEEIRTRSGIPPILVFNVVARTSRWDGSSSTSAQAVDRRVTSLRR